MEKEKMSRLLQALVCISLVICLYMTNVIAQENVISEVEQDKIEESSLVEEEIQTGFQNIEGQIYFILPDGSKYSGWYSSNGKTVYFDKNGVLQTKECVIDGKLYEFQENGEFLTGWINDNNVKYYYTECGSKSVGLKTIDGKNYYFLPNGVLLTNQSVGMYKADSDGVLMRMPYTLENLNAALDEILLETGTDIPSIGRYVKNRLKYKYIDRMDTREEMAVYALENRRCSCYYYEALSGLLLERAGYEVITIHGDGRVYAEHYWSLVKTTRDGIEGWYHVDVINDKYICTDQEMKACGAAWITSDYPASP